ncbi:MAG: phospholipase D-like domain-containing protein [Oscillospiraceae bacterium]
MAADAACPAGGAVGDDANPYTIAGQSTLEFFGELREKNIQFDLITNSEGSTPDDLAYSYYMLQRKQFYREGPRVFEYQSTDSLQGKAFLFDNRLSAVGSFNVDERSLHINTETMLVIDSPEFNSALANAINRYKEQSLVVGKNGVYLPSSTVEVQPVPFGKQFRMWMLSLLSRSVPFLL